MSKSTPDTVTEQLRQAIRDRGLSGYELAKLSGVPQPTVHRFLAGDGEPLARTIDALCRALGLELAEREG